MKVDRLGWKAEERANAVCNVINSEVPNSPDGSDLLSDKSMQFSKGIRFGKALSSRL